MNTSSYRQTVRDFFALKTTERREALGSYWTADDLEASKASIARIRGSDLWEPFAAAVEASIAAKLRPAGCRNRLRDEGLPYPRSGCAVCENGGMLGCPYDGTRTKSYPDDPGLKPQVRPKEETLSAFTVMAEHFGLKVAPGVTIVTPPACITLAEAPSREMWAAMGDAYMKVFHDNGRETTLPHDTVTAAIYAAIRKQLLESTT